MKGFKYKEYDRKGILGFSIKCTVLQNLIGKRSFAVIVLPATSYDGGKFSREIYWINKSFPNECFLRIIRYWLLAKL